MLQDMVDSLIQQEKLDLEIEREQDRQAAKEAYDSLMLHVQQYLPSLWREHEKSNVVTGCMLVKKDNPNCGLNGHNTPALVLEDKFLLYFFRNSAYYQMTISLKYGEFGMRQSYKDTFECEFNKKTCDTDFVRLLQKAEARYSYVQQMTNLGYSWKLD